MSASLRIGLIGLDTSHVVAFTKLLNDPSNEHHIPNGKVVVAFPGGSDDFELSYSRVEGFTNELRDDYQVKIVDDCEQVAAASDMVFITSVDGRVHLEQFKQIVSHGKPTFIDKPLAVCSEHAREIFRLAEDAGVPLMSSSSLRYMDGLAVALSAEKLAELGSVRGCDAFGPMAIEPTQPGLYWYGIHTVDMVERVMGPGCERVQTDTNDNADVVTATWSDGRVATVRGNRNTHSSFGITLHHEKGFQHVDMAAGRPGYAAMLAAVFDSLPNGTPDVPPEQAIEVIRLIEAANQSRDSGAVVKL